MSGAFTPRGYRDLVTALLDRGYDARRYETAAAHERHLILRHDLDMSLDAALPIAEIEHALGVRAIYFVLVRGELYNPYSEASRRTLERIIEMGHDIGLHLDAAHYGDHKALEKGAANECLVLETIIGRPVPAISFHRPSNELLGYEGTLAGRHHAYEPRFFKDMGYVSDSRGAWHHGQPLDHEAVSAGRALQLLTHPIWWQDPPVPPEARLIEFLNARCDFIDRELAENCGVHRPAGRSTET